MNKINFNQTGGFPLSTNILDAMQNAYQLLNHLGGLAGNLAIISGCELTGNSVEDGVVFISGELYSFKGGNLGANVIIKEEITSKTFEDGSTKPVIIKRYATFGSGTPEKTFSWNHFKRVFPTTMLNEKHLEIENRLKKLENKKSPIPIGLVAIWGKPASEPIPEGWKECTDLRGKMPVGHNPDYRIYSEWDEIDHHLNEIGYTGGESAHQLTIEEMPSHNHLIYGQDNNALATGRASDEVANIENYLSSKAYNHRYTDKKGNDKAHNNMPPYRVIRFIEFVGFEN